jgi:PhnB protein
MPAPGSKVGHAEIVIENALIMPADEFPDMNCKSPQAYGGSPVSSMIYVTDVERFVQRAVDAVQN